MTTSGDPVAYETRPSNTSDTPKGYVYPAPSIAGGSVTSGSTPAPRRLSADTLRRIQAVLQSDTPAPQPPSA